MVDDASIVNVILCALQARDEPAFVLTVGPGVPGDRWIHWMLKTDNGPDISQSDLDELGLKLGVLEQADVGRLSTGE